MAHTKATTKSAATTTRRRPAAADAVDLAVAELTEDFVVFDIGRLEAALKESGENAETAVAGIVKVGFPYSAEDYGDDDFDE